MASFTRGGTDMSQFLRQLNTIAPNEPEEQFDMPSDLEMFTHTTFHDFDTDTRTDFSQPAAKPSSDTHSPTSTKATEATSAAMTMGGDFAMDFINPTGEFSFSDFGNPYTSPTVNNFDNIGSLQPIQPNPQSVYPPVPQHAHQHDPYAHHAGGQPKTGDKRRSTEPQLPQRTMTIEEASRIAAEEDKRRRNTAASARFRVKKKQREQALEKSAKEMSDKVAQLESKIQALETENQWLKKLVLEKNEGKEIAKMVNGAKNEGKGEADAKAKDEAEAKKAKVETS